MRTQDIEIGSTYRCRVGSRLALVTVTAAPRYPSRRYRCRTHDTDRDILATAARLRPIPGTALADAERERLAAAAARRAVARAPRPFTGSTGDRMAEATAVPGVLANVGPSPVVALSAANAAYIRRIVGGVHVAERFPVVARAVRRAVGSNVIFRTIPRALRRGLLYAAAREHSSNGSIYRATMGHDPLPSPRMVAEAVGIACGLGAMPR